MHNECSVAFLRVCQLMIGMIDSAEDGDKMRLIMLARNLDEDTKSFIGELLLLAKVTDEDMDKFVPSDEDDEELLKDAASADMIKTAKVT